MENTEDFFYSKNQPIPNYRYAKNIPAIFNFFDDMGTGIIEIDPEGHIKRINSKAAFLLGTTPQDTIHRIIWSYPWHFYKKNHLKIPKDKNPIFLALKKKIGFL